MKTKPLFLLIFPLLIWLLAVVAWLYARQWHLGFADLFAPSHTLSIDNLLFVNNTLPRMAMGLLAGGALAVTAVLLQQVMHNPLASDSTLAVSSGAQTALLVATIFAPSTLLWGSGMVAFAGAVLALLGVLALSARRGLAPLVVVLSGLVMSLYLSALTGALGLFYAEEARGLAMWGAGSLVQDSWHDVGVLAVVCALVSGGIALLIKPLNIMALSDEQAQSLGIPVWGVRFAALALAAILAAYVVALVGMMGFVGLAASAAVRLAGVRTLLARLGWAFVLGALLLAGVDGALLLILQTWAVDLPAGAVSALAGAPLVLFLMNKAAVPNEHASRGARQRIRHAPAFTLKILPMILLILLAISLTLGQTETGIEFSGSLNIWEWRYPRILAAVACGILSALAGVLLQRLTGNAMASPELLGIGSGTAVGVMAAVWWWNATGVWFWLSGVAGALCTLLAIVLFNRKNGMQPEKILLTGMALAALSSALVQIWSASGDYRIVQMQTWLSGSTYAVSGSQAVILLICAVIFWAMCLPMQRWLGLLGLNATVAAANGVSVSWARGVLIVLAAAMTALSTLTIGPLSFVGLIAPHLALMLGARLPQQQLVYAALLGATLMVLADFVGRQIMFPYEIPAGVVATVLGGAYFLWAMRKM